MNKICALFSIQYPIIQGGMVWYSGWELASAVSNAGGLGLIGAGSMDEETLIHHIRKVKENTQKPFGVNIPLMRRNSKELLEVMMREKVPVIFTSAGNPGAWTQKLKDEGIKVAHVIANKKFAGKAIDSGVDAIVAEGFEAGGHNGKEETTTMALIPAIKSICSIPLIAAGGIYSGETMLAAMNLGADGVQIGSRFAVAEESSAHANFKQRVIEAVEGDTMLKLKKVVPVRLLKNDFYDKVTQAEDRGAGMMELKDLLGFGRSKKGIFEGDMSEGELEIGQASININKVQPAKEIIDEIISGYKKALEDTKTNNKFVF